MKTKLQAALCCPVPIKGTRNFDLILNEVITTDQPIIISKADEKKLYCFLSPITHR